jgi:hypothetical protein
MTWHVVDSQSTHVKPIYHGGLKVLVEVPNAPDWAACWPMLWLTLALPPGPPLALPPTETPPAPPAPPVAVPVLLAVCVAVLLVSNSAAALCVVTNPIAVAATIASAVIANDVLFMYSYCAVIMSYNNLWKNSNKYLLSANCVTFLHI